MPTGTPEDNKDKVRSAIIEWCKAAGVEIFTQEDVLAMIQLIGTSDYPYAPFNIYIRNEIRIQKVYQVLNLMYGKEIDLPYDFLLNPDGKR